MENIAFVCNQEINQQEQAAYIARGRELYGRALEKVDVKLDGEFADIHYYTKNVPFDRIRRITGYLVGTLDRFNNAKKAEEHDRVKHAVNE